MRKILTIALVALMAASLFAGVKTSGFVQGTVHADFDEKVATGSKSADPVLNAADGDNKAQIVITDENKVWGTTITVQNTKDFGLISKTWLDIMKVAQVENDFSAKVTFLTYDKIAGLSAYTNKADKKNVWRVRTANEGHGVNAEFAYSKYVKAQAGIQIYDGAITQDNRDDSLKTHRPTFVASVLGTPVDGVKLSAGTLIWNFDTDKVASQYVVAAEVDVAKLADLDFSLAGGITYKNNYKGKDTNGKTYDGDMTAQVFGGYDIFSGYVEVGFLETKKYTKLGAACDVAENADVGVYFCTTDYTSIKFDENVTIGVEGNYKLNKAVSFYGNIEKGNAKGSVTKKYFSTIDVEARMKVAF